MGHSLIRGKHKVGSTLTGNTVRVPDVNGSVIETEGILKRPPVVPVLQSCLTAVGSVVEQLAGTAI